MLLVFEKVLSCRKMFFGVVLLFLMFIVVGCFLVEMCLVRCLILLFLVDVIFVGGVSCVYDVLVSLFGMSVLILI